jgi:cytochrome c oxidase subunit 1
MASFWVAVPAGILMLASFWVEGGASAAGWTGYAPLSANPEYTGVNLGQKIWCLSLVILGLSSILGSMNYITTVINLRAPGMTWFRLPLSIWALFITSILVLLAMPILSGALIMLLFDQTLGTHFFRPDQGGQPLLWQHLFWFFGHPEVYILILPAMGFASDIIANGARKPIFGYRSMVYAIMGIGFLGWIVWGHHMFMSGMNPKLGTAFMISTMLIAVPSAIKVFNWLGTLWGGSIRFTVPMLHALAFVGMFVIGGLSGVFMASTPVDIYIHDTYFIVAHLHYVLFGGSLFAIFGAISFWYPKMFGRMMHPGLGKAHFWLTFVFYNLVFFPMHQLGLQGHMRRIYDPTVYDFLKPLSGLNRFISISAFVLFSSQLLFAINFIGSWFRGRKAPDNPWDDTGLEWTTPSPAPHGNWEKPPRVYNGPYEFNNPRAPGEFLAQTEPLEALPAPTGAPAPSRVPARSGDKT